VSRLEPRFKLWLSGSDVEGAFGDGKWRLLDAIEREGSISAASQSLGISYRKAWGDLKKAQIALGTALVAKQRGGKAGGQTVLTAEGRKWLKAYGRLRGRAEETIRQAWAECVEEVGE
jgi:molybdate transport system regulatory protein